MLKLCQLHLELRFKLMQPVPCWLVSLVRKRENIKVCEFGANISTVGEGLKHSGVSIDHWVYTIGLESVWDNHESNMLMTCYVEEVMFWFPVLLQGKNNSLKTIWWEIKFFS